jgi:hypothetical protein
MAQRFSTRTLPRAVDAPSDGHIRLVAPALALMLGMTAIPLPACDMLASEIILWSATSWPGEPTSARCSRAKSTYALAESSPCLMYAATNKINHANRSRDVLFVV